MKVVCFKWTINQYTIFSLNLGYKTLWEKEKMLFPSIFSFSNIVFIIIFMSPGLCTLSFLYAVGNKNIEGTVKLEGQDGPGSLT